MKNIIRFGLVLILLGITSPAFNQVIYYITDSKELRYLDLSTCTDTLIMPLLNPNNSGDGATDCAIGPDGTIYACFAFNDLFKVDPVTMQLTYLTTFSDVVSGLVCDAQGVVWAGGFALFSYDPVNATTTNYGSFDWFAGQTVGGDLTFRNGNLYMIDALNKIRKVDVQNPINSPVVYDLSATNLESAYGLFSIYYSCDSIVTYTSGTIGPDSKMAEVNFNNGNITLLPCIFPPEALIYGAATPLEYLGSIPCTQEFTLDADHSSGLANGDYASPASFCPHDSMPVGDSDVQLIYYKNIDSIQLYLIGSSVLDPGAEYLTAGVIGGLSYAGNGTSLLSLYGQPNAPDSVFRKALLQVVYINTASLPSPGIRIVQVIPWSGGIALDTARAYLQIPVTPTGSMVLKTCPGVPYVYQGVALQAGQTQDFMLSSFLGCDSIVTVTVQALPVSASSLIVKTCPGVPFVYQGIALQAGQTQDFTLNSVLGCDSIVTIIVQTLPAAEFDVVSQASCSNSPTGKLQIQHITGGSAPFEFSLDSHQFQGETRFDNLPAGEQTIYLQDQNGCTTEKTVNIPVLEPLLVTLDDALLTCNNLEILLRPTVSGDQTALQYKWSTGNVSPSITVTEDGPIWVEVSNSCATIHREASVRWATGSDSLLVFFPNVISLQALEPINQIFRPFFAKELTILHYHLEVFDRWGNLVFESSQHEKGWDGQWRNHLVGSSVFIWQMQADTLFCGHQIHINKSGDVLILDH